MNKQKKMKLLEKCQKEVFNEMEKIYDSSERKRCCVITATGFGKTHNAAKFILKRNEIKKVLFITPSKSRFSEKYDKEFASKGKTIIYDSYIHFARMYKIEKDKFVDNFIKDKLEGIDLIIFDEAHYLGGRKSHMAFKRVINDFDIPYIGLTATPIRMDKLDIVEDFFGSDFVSKYSVKECIEIGLFEKPVYIINNMEYIDKVLQNLKNKVDNDVKKADIENKLLNYTNGSEIIKRHLLNPKYNINTSYMKFIVYFVSLIDLESYYNNVVDWFKKAFPNHDINNLICTSHYDYSNNIELVDSLEKRENCIDLIFSINQLNEVYHSEYLTGEIFLRSTYSPRIYAQQFGRCLDVIKTNTSIIFDLICNADRQNKISKIYGSDLLKNIYQDLDELVPAIIIDENATIDRYTQRIIDSMEKVYQILFDNGLSFEENVISLYNRNFPIEKISEITRKKISEINEIIDKRKKVI